MRHVLSRAASQGLVLVALAITVANASIIKDLTLAELHEAAEIIVDAEVVSMESYWFEERSQIKTAIELRPNLFVKGEGEGSVWVHELGGLHGSLMTRIIDGPEFEMGDRVLVFLNRHPGTGQLRCVAACKGRMTIEGDVVMTTDRCGARSVATYDPAASELSRSGDPSNLDYERTIQYLQSLERSGG